ncbi:MAG: TraX family protein [Filifactoraceae bacterium]
MTSFTLKSIALILMVVDHIGLYFHTAPPWFRFVGRGSYPIFLFCMVWSYHYTNDRKKYLLRLYLMSVFMTIFSYIIDTMLPTEMGYGNHNIFLSMFIVAVIISTIEIYIQDKIKGGIILGIIAFTQTLYFLIPNINGDLLTGIIPNLSLNEYGFEFIILGVAMYFLKENKKALTATYIIFCIQQFSSEMLNYGMATQWIMIVALPLILKYNNNKGYSLKYFFYIFYPTHSFLLFYISNFLVGK